MGNQSDNQVAVMQAASLPQLASTPQYDRNSLGTGIVHMSVGGFHRSHQALFVHEYLNLHPENWMIFGVGCLPSDDVLVAAMGAQENLYTLTERSGTDDVIKLIGSIKEFVHAPSNPQTVIDAIASNETHIVSLTVTEKGYYYDTSGNLDMSHPMVAGDLADGAVPKTAMGLLFAGLEQRMSAGGTPITVMSCDNLPGNGNLTKRILLQFCDAKNPEVHSWIEANVSFPNSMVDRITPVPNEQTVALVAEKFGINDPCAVASESFIQWILEDNFIAGRPQLEQVGVQFVDEVEPYEKLKVRMLNGSHSALSYVSYLMGYRDVDVAMSDPLIADFVRRYMDEDITPTIPPVPGVDVDLYKTTLIQRFSNPAIRDQVQRLAMDGSQKIPNAIVPPLEIQLENGGSIRWMAFAIAGWYRYLRGIDEAGVKIDIVDPLAGKLIDAASTEPTDATPLLTMTEIFGPKLGTNQQLVAATNTALQEINAMGMRDALIKTLQM